MDSNTKFAVLVTLFVVSVGVSHWRLSAQIDRVSRADAQADVETTDGAPEPPRTDASDDEADHYQRMAEAAVSANDPAARKASLRYLIKMSKTDDDIDSNMIDWARSELARLKAQESPGLLGKKLKLEVSDDAPKADEKSKGARPPDKGLVDPF